MRFQTIVFTLFDSWSSDLGTWTQHQLLIDWYAAATLLVWGHITNPYRFDLALLSLSLMMPDANSVCRWLVGCAKCCAIASLMVRRLFLLLAHMPPPPDDDNAFISYIRVHRDEPTNSPWRTDLVPFIIISCNYLKKSKLTSSSDFYDSLL